MSSSALLSVDGSPALSSGALPSGHWLEGYAPPEGSWDEVLAPDGEVRPAWREFAVATAEFSPAEWTRQGEAIARRLRDHGATYNVYSDARGLARPWVLDTVPLLLEREEFLEVAEGLRQRARLLNAIMADLYGPQRLLTEGWLPPALVYGNAGYLREARGAAPRAPWISLLATDLARGPDGRWIVLADRSQAPSGKGYALENRTVLTQHWPELFRRCGAQPLADFFDLEGEALKELSPSRRENPLVVLLSPGPFNETYFEHSFKARQLGFQLVEGADLTVRDRRVYLKTLEGLRRVEVIVRRVDDVYCDPLEWKPEAWLGVAGLAEAWRGGHVSVVNAFGAGVVETPAFFPFLPGLCRHLLGEELRLPQVTTWWMGQEKEGRAVLAERDRWVIKSAFVGQKRAPVFLAEADVATREETLRALETTPERFVAQEPLRLSTLPTWRDGRVEPRRLVWRAYTHCTLEGELVLPGGLTRVSQAAAGSIVTMQYGGISKDTWVLGDIGEVIHEEPAAPAVVRPPRSTTGVPSRLADQLFWFGRYAERLEHVVRLTRAGLRRLTGEDTEEQEEQARALEYLILTTLKSLAEAEAKVVAGQNGAATTTTASPSFIARLRRLLGDRELADAVPTLARRLHFNAAASRDRLSDDMWRVVTRLTSLADSPAFAVAPPLELLDQLDTFILHLSALNGMEAENMTRGHGWRFMEFGLRLERALGLLELCGAAARGHATQPGLLEPLLEIADSTMTYRRLYQPEPHLLAVLDLLLANEANPRSAAFQLGWLARQSPQMPRDESSGPAREKEACDHLLSMLSSLNLNTLLNAPPELVAAKIGALCQSLVLSLEGVSELLNAHYFNHAIPKKH